MKLIFLIMAIQLFYYLFKCGKFSYSGGKVDAASATSKFSHVMLERNTPFRSVSGTGHTDYCDEPCYFAELEVKSYILFSMYQVMDKETLWLVLNVGNEVIKLPYDDFKGLIALCKLEVSKQPNRLRRGIISKAAGVEVISNRGEWQDQGTCYYTDLHSEKLKARLLTLYQKCYREEWFIAFLIEDTLVSIPHEKFLEMLEECEADILASPSNNDELFGGLMDREMVEVFNSPEIKAKLQKLLTDHQQRSRSGENLPESD